MKTTHYLSANASLEYNETSQTMFISYQGKVSASTILRVHSWMRAVVNQFGIRNVRGTVVDLSGVATFMPNPLTTLQVTGMVGRHEYDFYQLPAAMIVRNTYQEKMLSMVYNSDHVVEQFRTVYDMNSAKQFIESCVEADVKPGLFDVAALFGSPLSTAQV